MTKKKDWREDGVPFTPAHGTFPAEYLEYAGYGAHRGVQMVPADDFWATLKVEHQERGQSAARVIVTDWSTGTIYRIFLGDFVEMVKTVAAPNPGLYTGRWEFVKRGQNYGVKLK